MSSHRIWWLVALCALGVGIAIEADSPAAGGADGSFAARAAAAASLPAAVPAGRDVALTASAGQAANPRPPASARDGTG